MGNHKYEVEWQELMLRMVPSKSGVQGLLMPLRRQNYCGSFVNPCMHEVQTGISTEQTLSLRGVVGKYRLDEGLVRYLYADQPFSIRDTPLLARS